MNSCDCNPNIELFRGTTYSQTWRYGVEPFVYVPITGVPNATPLTLTVVAHGAPTGWPVAITDLGDFKKLNAVNWPPEGDDFRPATVIDADTLVFNTIDAGRLGTYDGGGGRIAYLTPWPLAGASAVFHAYPIGSTTPVFSNAAVLDDTAKTITVHISEANIALLTAPQYAFALVATDADANIGVVERGLIDVAELSASA